MRSGIPRGSSVAILVLVLGLGAVCGTACSGGASATRAPLPPIDPALSPTVVASLAELTAAGTFEVVAHVVSVPNCPACEGPAPCEPCGAMHLNLILSDGPPPPAPLPSGRYVDPQGLDTSAFERGAMYRFVLGVEILGEGEPYLYLLGAADTE